jgi:hypothetical protein
MQDIYTYTVPSFIKGLTGLKTILEKTRAHLAEQGKDESAFLQERLIEDMFPFIKQVQIATDNAKGIVKRVTDIETPVFEDTETTFDELFARIDRTVEFLKTVPEESFKDAASRKVVLPFTPPDQFMTGFDYAREFTIPNFYFHVTIAYAIARKEGVVLSKTDYIAGLPLRDQ